jgi:hypothetical protein
MAGRKLTDDEKRKAREYALKHERLKYPGATTVNVKVSDTLTDHGEIQYSTGVTIETVTLLKAPETATILKASKS